MASHSITRPARRFVLPFILFLIIILTRHLLLMNLDFTILSSASRLQTRVHIQGRWKSIRGSLGLLPLPEFVSFPQSPVIESSIFLSRTSRFDLKRKRSLEATAQKSKLPQLHFANDALVQPSVPLDQMAASFRAIALAEKGIAMEQARARLQTQGQRQRGRRRPSSWSTRIAKISLGKR
jgi:hypothetical protein